MCRPRRVVVVPPARLLAEHARTHAHTHTHTHGGDGRQPVRGEQRPRVSDVQRVLRTACRDAAFRRRGLEACQHIVRRSMHRIVGAALELYFGGERQRHSAAWRNPVIAPGGAAALADQLHGRICATQLSYTTCPPRTVDSFILPDEALWELSAAERAALADRRATLRGSGSGSAGANANADADALRAHDAVLRDDAAASVDRPRRDAQPAQFASEAEYAWAADEAIDFDDDESDEEEQFADEDDPNPHPDIYYHPVYLKDKQERQPLYHDEVFSFCFLFFLFFCFVFFFLFVLFFCFFLFCFVLFVCNSLTFYSKKKNSPNKNPISTTTLINNNNNNNNNNKLSTTK